MQKLKLEIDNLRVESFDTTSAAGDKGTVFGEQCTCYTQCTCPGCPTCDATCAATCAASCDCGSGTGGTGTGGTGTGGTGYETRYDLYTCWAGCTVNNGM